MKISSAAKIPQIAQFATLPTVIQGPEETSRSMISTGIKANVATKIAGSKGWLRDRSQLAATSRLPFAPAIASLGPPKCQPSDRDCTDLLLARNWRSALVCEKLDLGGLVHVSREQRVPQRFSQAMPSLSRSSPRL